MIRVSDLPSFCEFKTLEPLEGQGTGELALQKHLPYIRDLCQDGYEDIYVNAATGSGKSRLLPDVLAESCRHRCHGNACCRIFYIQIWLFHFFGLNLCEGFFVVS